MIMEQQYCQSCGMPMNTAEAIYGTNSDGSNNNEYCKYCFDNGEFTSNMTMEEMIDLCAPYVVESNPSMSEDDARKMMNDFYPTLVRWKKQ
jgi:hypothetical protein